MYVKEEKFPVLLEIPALHLLKSLELEDNEPMEVRLAELLKLQESKAKAFNSLHNCQQTVKRWFDEKISNPGFKCKDLVVKYNECGAKPGQHAKFDSLWESPFCIFDYKEFNAFVLENMQGELLEILVNGIHLKPFN